MTEELVIEAADIYKDYGHVQALRGASLQVRRGEIVALVGDNGAGKSTLMKAMCGVVQPDGGEIRILGRPVQLTSARDAHELGVQSVYQDLSLAPDLTIPANIFLGIEMLRPGVLGKLGVLSRASMARESDAALRALGIELPTVNIAIENLSGGQRQAVAIARAVRWAENAILMDEPTAALGARQTEIVVNTIRTVADRGLGVLLISHDMPRMLSLAHRVVVLRHGAVVADFRAEEATIPLIVSAMLGAVREAVNGHR
jgi:simple sugar transport system ATP-binding protein